MSPVYDFLKSKQPGEIEWNYVKVSVPSIWRRRSVAGVVSCQAAIAAMATPAAVRCQSCSKACAKRSGE
jgi:hypothetical protein